MTSPSEPRLTLAKPSIGPQEEAAVLRVLRSGRLVNGPEVTAFERALAEELGVAHAVAVSSGTAALQLILEALALERGRRVIVPDFCYPAVANAVELSGLEPLLVDVHPETYALDPASVVEALDDSVAAILQVHQFGGPAPLDDLAQVVAGRDVALVEDAACALGSTCGGVMCGTMGIAGAFSFHPRKTITTGEGGAVVTDDDALAKAVRSLRSHGVEPEGRRWHPFQRLGHNLRMGEVEGALGRVQLARHRELLEGRRRVAARYLERLASLGAIRIPGILREPGHNYQSFVVEVDGGVARDAIIDGLAARGIETTIGTYAIHRMPYHAALARGGALEVSARAFERSLALPLHPAMTDDDVQRVVDALGEML